MTTENFVKEVTGDNTYAHLMGDYDLRPLQIKAHLIEAHHVEPKTPRKRYERECWHSQHESLHNTHISGF